MSEQASQYPLHPDEYKAFFERLEEYCRAEAEQWDRLPDIGLYMDQVVGYLNSHLTPFNWIEDGGLTPSMVNNYVKLAYIERPENKKYSRAQIAALYLLCSLKQVLPIGTASSLLHYLSAPPFGNIEDLYTAFADKQKKAAEEIAGVLLPLKEGKREELLRVALDCALKAESLRLMAEQLVKVAVTSDEQDNQAQKEKEKQEAEKEKEKAKKAKELVEAEKAKEKAEAKKAKDTAKKAKAAAEKASRTAANEKK